jgi:hypothetical protein
VNFERQDREERVFYKDNAKFDLINSAFHALDVYTIVISNVEREYKYRNSGLFVIWSTKVHHTPKAKRTKQFRGYDV